jgi:hypothetical protein
MYVWIRDIAYRQLSLYIYTHLLDRKTGKRPGPVKGGCNESGCHVTSGSNWFPALMRPGLSDRSRERELERTLVFGLELVKRYIYLIHVSKQEGVVYN